MLKSLSLNKNNELTINKSINNRAIWSYEMYFSGIFHLQIYNINVT